MAAERCRCACHQIYRANQRACATDGRHLDAFREAQRASYAEMNDPGPDLRDHVAAVWSCALCVNRHMPAFHSVWPLPGGSQWTDATPDDGEGQEV